MALEAPKQPVQGLFSVSALCCGMQKAKSLLLMAEDTQ